MGRAAGYAVLEKYGREHFAEMGRRGKGKHDAPPQKTFDELMATDWRARRRAARIRSQVMGTPRRPGDGRRANPLEVLPIDRSPNDAP